MVHLTAYSETKTTASTDRMICRTQIGRKRADTEACPGKNIRVSSLRTESNWLRIGHRWKYSPIHHCRQLKILQLKSDEDFSEVAYLLLPVKFYSKLQLYTYIYIYAVSSSLSEHPRVILNFTPTVSRLCLAHCASHPTVMAVEVTHLSSGMFVRFSVSISSQNV